MVGGSSTGLTVNTNVSLGVDEPSVTVTVMVAEPLWFGAGVTAIVRLAPLPPNVIFAFGTRAVFDEFAVNVRLPTAVSASPTVKFKTPVELSSFNTWSGISEMVGGLFGVALTGVFMSV